LPDDGKSTRAKLTITRNKPNDVKRRQVYVALDGEKLGFLLYGDSFTWDITPGHHTLKVNNTLFWKKIEFDAAGGEHVRFAINNYTGRAFYALVLVFGIAPLYLSIERET
jgi:hypothetical protein